LRLSWSWSVGANYALYKFRRPYEHVSVDLDIHVRVEDVLRAVRALGYRGFRVNHLGALHSYPR
jgi:hypothetical protein